MSPCLFLPDAITLITSGLVIDDLYLYFFQSQSFIGNKDFKHMHIVVFLSHIFCNYHFKNTVTFPSQQPQLCNYQCKYYNLMKSITEQKLHTNISINITYE